ncbi:hypothetical protein KSP40_PGU003382 [Platanthera guangdongensis]|uniref:Uncharacterized protein n=1 Tax=Platanthera guangdongensis TaxID=2320717 RepID=A0ABR2MPY6_9ASPA
MCGESNGFRTAGGAMMSSSSSNRECRETTTGSRNGSVGSPEHGPTEEATLWPVGAARRVGRQEKSGKESGRFPGGGNAGAGGGRAGEGGGEITRGDGASDLRGGESGGRTNTVERGGISPTGGGGDGGDDGGGSGDSGDDGGRDDGGGGDCMKCELRLLEVATFLTITGTGYMIRRELSIHNYFGCFFSLPIVISCMRWGLAAGRKTMVATAILLFVLSGPLKATTYLLMHGLVGLTMGSLWRLRLSWGVSLALCSLVRLIGVIGYIMITSFLIRENILNLITINVHASLTYVLTAIGVNVIPTMGAIYAIFGTLLMLNCGFFVFLLHILYSVFLTKLGMKASLALPRWLEKAI